MDQWSATNGTSSVTCIKICQSSGLLFVPANELNDFTLLTKDSYIRWASYISPVKKLGIIIPMLWDLYSPVVEKEKFIFGFDNNVTNICNNRTIVLVLMALDCYKLVVLDHCHWTLNFARLEANISEYINNIFSCSKLDVFTLDHTLWSTSF